MPILTDILDKVTELIEGMTQSGGYNSTWGKTNVEDEAITELTAKFPNAIIELDYDIVNLDLTNATSACEYKNQIAIKIIARVRAEQHSQQPRYSQQVEINKALEDLMRCFGDSDNDNELAGVGCEYFMFSGARKIVRTNGDVFQPYDLETTWNFQWNCLRSNPGQIAC